VCVDVAGRSPILINQRSDPERSHVLYTSCVFLVHGVRYQEGASDAIDQLRPGDELALEPEQSDRP
jgi:hypothetical protein